MTPSSQIRSASRVGPSARPSRQRPGCRFWCVCVMGRAEQGRKGPKRAEKVVTVWSFGFRATASTPWPTAPRALGPCAKPWARPTTPSERTSAWCSRSGGAWAKAGTESKQSKEIDVVSKAGRKERKPLNVVGTFAYKCKCCSVQTNSQPM